MKQKKSLKNKMWSGLFWKFGERITAQLVSLVVSIILARLLSPSDYGAVSLVLIFITIANVFVTNGLGSALIQKKDADNLDFSSVFYINIAISIAIYGLLFFIAPSIANFYDLPVLKPALRVLGIRIIVAAINSVQQAYVSKNMMFKRFFWSTLFGTVISGIVGVFLAYRGYGVWALILQYFTNTCIDTIVLWFTVRWRPQPKCSFKRSKGLISFGWKILLSALIDTGYVQLRGILIGKIYAKEELAFFNQGDKYPALIANNVNPSINAVLFPAMSQVQDDRNRIKLMTRTVIQVSSYFMWPIMIGLAVVAEPLVSILLTDKWLPCVPYMRIFCFTYGLWPIHTSNLQAINAMGRSDLYLKLEIIKKVIGIITLIISIQYGPLAIAISLVVTGIISTFINAWPNVKLLGYRLMEQIEDMLPSFVIASVMGSIIFLFKYFINNNLFLLVTQVICGVIIYIICSMFTKNKGYLYILKLIKGNKVR